MSREILSNMEMIGYLVPLLVVTLAQAKAIINRDNHQCLFVSPHTCKGKLSIHHINDKRDNPENLVTVCHQAHWKYLHNGATPEQLAEWKNNLALNAKERTENASKKGWIFPR